ncbi:MAG: hypothetical protein AAGF24_14980 [Cyanobacteria bacterium P01_H01_bin.121]
MTTSLSELLDRRIEIKLMMTALQEELGDLKQQLLAELDQKTTLYKGTKFVRCCPAN